MQASRRIDPIGAEGIREGGYSVGKLDMIGQAIRLGSLLPF